MPEAKDQDFDILLSHMAEQKLIKRHDAGTISLSRQGKVLALKVIGGKDIDLVARALVKLLVHKGDILGTHYEDTLSLWAMMCRVSQAMKMASGSAWPQIEAQFVATLSKKERK